MGFEKSFEMGSGIAMQSSMRIRVQLTPRVRVTPVDDRGSAA